ncbi:aspartyl protease family protein [Natronocella acetinitrilica]|uniref:Aspartyl protease family protein n=1 Tax=Natronocella acetinitrilica TaxID=414046 RepID=A0AAE3KAR2_9GAMM|nr:aspartyl protease family protein [Natronocella acetinitrilica]
MTRISLFLFLVLPWATCAASYPHVVALFSGQAMVELDGDRHLLREGDVLPNGMRLLSASSDGAVFDHDGQRLELGLTNRVGGAFQGSAGATDVRISPDRSGMYRADGRINDVPVRFVVDTGASAVAISGDLARSLGVDYRQGLRIRVTTASGESTGYRVTLPRVSLGGIERRDVVAVVLDGAFPREPLLGMSFLGQLRMRSTGQILVLEVPN